MNPVMAWSARSVGLFAGSRCKADISSPPALSDIIVGAQRGGIYEPIADQHIRTRVSTVMPLMGFPDVFGVL